MIELGDVDQAVADHLADVIGKPFGVADVPSANTPKPYGIVYPTQGEGESGSFGKPMDELDLVYMVTSVGSSAEQCRWLASRVSNALRSLMWYSGGSGDPAFQVASVLFQASGGLVREDEYTYHQADTFTVCVEEV